MSPLGAVITSQGSFNSPGSLPRTPGCPSAISTSPSGENLMTWWPLSSVPCESVTQTFPSASTWMPWGSTKSPAPKLARISPVSRWNLKIGSTRFSAHPPASPTPPHRSYAQMCPSIGSMSTPAVEPHSRPSGRSTQSAMTVGFGFGSSSAGSSMGLGSMGVASTSADSSAPSSAAQPAAHSRPASNAGVEIRETMRLLMTVPRGFGPWCVPRPGTP